MKINNRVVNIPSLQIEKIDEEYVIYNVETNRISILNKSASVIFNMISKLKSDDMVTTNDIARHLMSLYNMEEERHEEVCRDVNEILDSFEGEKLLKIS